MAAGGIGRVRLGVCVQTFRSFLARSFGPEIPPRRGGSGWPEARRSRPRRSFRPGIPPPEAGRLGRTSSRGAGVSRGGLLFAVSSGHTTAGGLNPCYVDNSSDTDKRVQVSVARRRPAPGRPLHDESQPGFQSDGAVRDMSQASTARAPQRAAERTRRGHGVVRHAATRVAHGGRARRRHRLRPRFRPAAINRSPISRCSPPATSCRKVTTRVRVSR